MSVPRPAVCVMQKNIVSYSLNGKRSEGLGPPLPTLIPSPISNCVDYKVWHEITYPFPNFNDATVGWVILSRTLLVCN